MCKGNQSLRACTFMAGRPVIIHNLRLICVHHDILKSPVVTMACCDLSVCMKTLRSSC